MIVQACLNGTRPSGFPPRLPLTAQAMAGDAELCIAAGVAEPHLHSRGTSGTESLTAIDATIPAIRHACPGTFVGVSTGARIEGDDSRTGAAIARPRRWSNRIGLEDGRHLRDGAVAADNSALVGNAVEIYRETPAD